MSDLGSRIRQRRAQLALSQARLAQAAGITASAVSQIESGAIRTLKDETLDRLACALQTTPLELMAGLSPAPELAADEQQLIDMYRALPAPLRAVALRLLKALP